MIGFSEFVQCKKLVQNILILPFIYIYTYVDCRVSLNRVYDYDFREQENIYVSQNPKQFNQNIIKFLKMLLIIFVYQIAVILAFNISYFYYKITFLNSTNKFKRLFCK